MRDLDPGFAAHIESGATTLANCWRIVRTDDVTYGFTDHDTALSFDGTTFDPAHGLDGGETAAKLGAQVDTTEIVAVVHASAISDDDVALGRLDGATVETWRVNWRDPDMRHLLRRDTIGEIVREDGVFRVELRSAQHALNVVKGRVYQSACDAELGDARCGIDLDQPAFKTTATVVTVSGRQSVLVTLADSFADGWFDFGRAEWSSGKMAGLRHRIVRQKMDGSETALLLNTPIADWAEPGDALTLFAGCDRRFATCKAKFANGANFRGFPHIPGSDFVLRYPKAGGDYNGQPLFR